MGRFAIEISTSDEGYFEFENKVVLGRNHYLGFVRIASRIGLWDDIRENTYMECDDCNSFIADVITFYDVIQSVLEFVDSKQFEKEFGLWETTFNKWEAIKGRLEQEYAETDDTEDSKEIAIILDGECMCNTQLVGKPKLTKTDEGAPDFGDRNGSVSKFVGPKKRWR
jgi:hypothetical protein